MSAQTFAPGAVEALGNRDNGLRSGYGDASVQGIKGTLLPSCSGSEGASAGFNADALMPINVDPESPQGFVLQPGVIRSKERIRPMPASGFDQAGTRQLAADTLKQAVAASQRTTEEPKMTVQEPGPPPAPRRRRQAAAPAPAPVPTVVSVDTNAEAIPLPSKRVAFDFGPPFGEMETFYHSVVRESNNLVLGWDLRCRNAQRYKPSVSPTTITVRLAGQEFQVMSLGIGFTDEETQMQYIVLLIDMRKDGAQ